MTNIIHFKRGDIGIGELRRRIASARPDIVHVHGCWSVEVWRAARLCRKKRIPFVLSPERALEPWHVADGYWLHKLPMLLLFQLRMVRRAKALIAVTAQERDNLLTLSIVPIVKRRKPLNADIAVITTDDEKQRAEETERLYRKVADTHPFLTMSTEEIAAENILLRLGLARDGLSRTLNEDELHTARDIGEASWRKIQLHAADEGIIDDVRRGAEVVRPAVKDIDITTIERFDKHTRKNTQPLDTTTAKMSPLHLEEVSEEEKATAGDILICTVILNLRHEMVHKTVSKRHIADMYTALRFTDYDEDRVNRMLSVLGMRGFARRVLCIMSESLSLQEGFMPMPPLNDRKTAKIRHLLNRMNIQ